MNKNKKVYLKFLQKFGMVSPVLLITKTCLNDTYKINSQIKLNHYRKSIHNTIML